MSHKNKASLVKQTSDRLSSKLKIGSSKHEDKADGIYLDYIYSWETYRTYLKHCVLFVEYCKANFRCKTLDECFSHIADWFGSRSGLSPYTLKLEAAALRKLYGRRAEILIETPYRKRADIVRSRGSKKRDTHFSEDKNSALVAFCRFTGLRRSELRDLRGTNLTYHDGKYYVLVRSGKGGKKREVFIIGDVSFAVNLMKTAGERKVFSKINSAADIHSYRREYATAYYNMIARPVDALSRNEVFVCRKDQKGTRYDKAAMLTVSRSLGHNRIDVIAGHYLDLK